MWNSNIFATSLEIEFTLYSFMFLGEVLVCVTDTKQFVVKIMSYILDPIL